MTTVAEPATVDEFEVATVVETPTVVVSNPATVVRSGPAPSIWITEGGELVPGSRVKRIRLAQDVLNTAEESVYDTLWATRGAERDETGGDARIVQAGYDYLMKRTRLSKKTIQRIIDRLIEKDFIMIERPADIYTRSSTVYRVFSYRGVLDRQARKGRLHAVKIGPGFLYAHPLPDPRLNLTTVVTSDQTTDDTSAATTEAAGATPTGAVANQTTVVRQTTQKIEHNPEGRTASSSEVAALRKLLERQLGFVDDGALLQLLEACRRRAGDSTIEEIAYFVGVKLQWARHIQNPVGFVLTAVPRHFENGGHLSARELLRKQVEEERRRWQETHDYWKQVAGDPARPEAERAEARQVLQSLETP